MRLLKFLIPLLLCVNAWAITGQGSSRSASTNAHTDKALHMGEHVPVEYSGSGTISNTNSETFVTSFMQIGWANDAEIYLNNAITAYNPEIFTLFVALTTDGDSVSLTDAKFQIAGNAADTTVTVTLTVVNEKDTVAVGETLTGTTSGATCIVTGVIEDDTGADSIIVASMYPGTLFMNGVDTVGTNGTQGLTTATYSNLLEHSDSSNVFIDDGYYSHDQYGDWRYEDYSGAATEYRLMYRIRVWAGAYIRLYFADATVADVTTVTWTLKGEN